MLCLAVAVACGGAKTPTTATAPPSASVITVQVGIPGNGSSTLAPGETRQFFATATGTDGVPTDVTNLATWQSSAPSLATVSPSGLLTAAADGAVDVSATYKSTKGSHRVEIISCTVTVSPETAAFNAFGGSGIFAVTVNSPSCRWTAHSDQAWFPLSADPVTGNGNLSYALPPNSTPSVRTAKVIVSTSTGASATHAITEDKPLGCSYVTAPEELVFPASGGSGEFRVITTPADCQWTVKNGLSQFGVFIPAQYTDGRGSDLVRYTVPPQNRAEDVAGYLEVAGLSGLNPNGRHRVVILKKQ